MSLIEKIDAEINPLPGPHSARANDVRMNTGYLFGLERAKDIILSEQKEPCEYCTETSKIEMYIHDTVEDCKWCEKRKMR